MRRSTTSPSQTDVRVRLVIVPDEESEDIERRSSDDLVRRGYVGDFAITGEPTNLHIGVQAKGVLAARIHVRGRAAHGSTPWLGDNAIVKAVDVFRRIESMPFSRESSEMFDRPSINLGRIVGGDAPNKVPDACVMDVDIRYLPNQDPGDILEQIRMIPDIDVKRTFIFPPAHVSPSNPYVRALCEAVARRHGGASVSVGRDGASDAVSFLRAGVPAVEFGPSGEGHHGPEEWVSIRSLAPLPRSCSSTSRAPCRPGWPKALPPRRRCGRSRAARHEARGASAGGLQARPPSAARVPAGDGHHGAPRSPPPRCASSTTSSTRSASRAAPTSASPSSTRRPRAARARS